MDAWLSRNYKTVILVLSLMVGWQLFDRLVPRRVEARTQTIASSPAPARPTSTVPSSLERSTESGYSRSSTGKRHNSGCRYYDASKPCGPGDGVPCKICGG